MRSLRITRPRKSINTLAWKYAGKHEAHTHTQHTKCAEEWSHFCARMHVHACTHAHMHTHTQTNHHKLNEISLASLCKTFSCDIQRADTIRFVSNRAREPVRIMVIYLQFVRRYYTIYVLIGKHGNWLCNWPKAKRLLQSSSPGQCVTP